MNDPDPLSILAAFGAAEAPGSGPALDGIMLEISRGTLVAKAGSWTLTDAEARRPGERKGLDTPVVLAVNGARLVCGESTPCVPELTR